MRAIIVKKSKFKVLKTIILLGLVIAVFFVGVRFSGSFDKLWPGIAVKNTTDAKTIEESIHSMAELITLSYNYTDVGEFSDQKIITWAGYDIPLPFGEKSFIIAYDGEMKIGIDMGQVSINIQDKIIVVSMPKAKIISHTIEEGSVRLFDEKSGWFNPISITDYTVFMAERKPIMENKAIENGLLTQAEQNAQIQLEAFISSLPAIAAEYEISFIIQE